MTDRFVPPSVAVLEPFVRAGVLGMVEVHVTATMVESVRSDPSRSGGGSDGAGLPDEVVIAAALAVRAPLHGHVCVDLRHVAGSLVPAEGDAPTRRAVADVDGRDDEGPDPDLDLPALAGDAAEMSPGAVELPWPDPDGWAGRVLASPLARADGAPAGDLVEPLVVDGDALYLDRHWNDEVAVAADLRARAGVELDADAAAWAALDRYFPDPRSGGPDLQRAAAVAALEHQLAVIAGGPGTGKTRTVARLLAVLASSDGSVGGAGAGRPLEIALAAPTGKAAARLQEAIAAAVREADPPPEVARRLASLDARTLHRLLGARRGGSTFARTASDPLPADVVVVDEVSMVSLPLMARLLDAVRPDARVVLVGDPHQLASVEAGAVLGDVVGVQSGRPPAALAANVVTLETVHRFAADSPVGRLASAIREGHVDGVIALLSGRGADGAVDDPDGSVERVSWLDPGDDAGVDGVRRVVLAHAADLVDLGRAGRVDDALASLGSVKVLCATRRGPAGVDTWNTWVEQQLRLGGRMRRRYSSGRPLMVTANDYLNEVFNGDVGVVVRVGGAGGRPARPQVAFDGVDGARLIDPTRLDRLETQWAMTIHKSQGSEFDHVVVALPEPPSPILTRELLYTAVTRAKRAVTVIASEAAVRAAVERPVARASGLTARLS